MFRDLSVDLKTIFHELQDFSKILLTILSNKKTISSVHSFPNGLHYIQLHSTLFYSMFYTRPSYGPEKKAKQIVRSIEEAKDDAGTLKTVKVLVIYY